MSAYLTEEEQVEAIKKWWKENGISVVSGIAIGLAAVFGWQGWNNYQDNQGKQASVAFSQMLNAVDLGDMDLAGKQAELVRLDYSSSNYAVLAAMAQARIKLAAGESAAARSQLEWAIANSGDASLKRLAQLNLARILLSENDLDGAAKLADAGNGGFAGEFAELRGDIALARKDAGAARDAYTEALAMNAGNPQRLQMKLDDLAVANP